MAPRGTVGKPARKATLERAAALAEPPPAVRLAAPHLVRAGGSVSGRVADAVYDWLRAATGFVRPRVVMETVTETVTRGGHAGGAGGERYLAFEGGAVGEAQAAVPSDLQGARSRGTHARYGRCKHTNTNTHVTAVASTQTHKNTHTQTRARAVRVSGRGAGPDGLQGGRAGGEKARSPCPQGEKLIYEVLLTER